MNNPIITIVVPVYNTARYLEGCLTSIVQQVPDVKECDIVLVDDGSTDGSSEICDRFSLEYANISAIHQSNMGVSTARNKALDIARGEYVWFVDSDDRVADGAVGRLLTAIHDKEPDVVVFPIEEVNDAGSAVGVIPAPESADFRLMGPLQCGDPLYPVAHVMARSLIGDERFDETLAIHEDRDFLYRVLVKTKGEVEIIDVPLYHYLVTRQNSAINSHEARAEVDANAIYWRIFVQERKLGRPEPAFEQYAENTLGVLSVLSRTEGCRGDFERLRRELLDRSAFSHDLKGRLAMKYSLVSHAPSLFRVLARATWRRRDARRAREDARLA